MNTTFGPSERCSDAEGILVAEDNKAELMYTWHRIVILINSTIKTTHNCLVFQYLTDRIKGDACTKEILSVVFKRGLLIPT